MNIFLPKAVCYTLFMGKKKARYKLETLQQEASINGKTSHPGLRILARIVARNISAKANNSTREKLERCQNNENIP